MKEKGKFLTPDEAQTWITDYHLGKFAPKKMGQAFCEKFQVLDAALFYMGGTARAKKHIFNTYVQPDAG